MGRSSTFRFDGGAATYVGTGILAFLLTVFTLGLGVPWATTLFHRWRSRHTYVEGRRLIFMGSGLSLFGNYIKWWLLTVVTVGIYGFWVVPRVVKWVVENTDFDPTHQPVSAAEAA